MHIHQVKTRLVNSYVVEYPDRLLVMDVAVGCHRYVLGFIEQVLGRSVHDVKLVVCSHDDPDHMGGLRALAHLCGAPVAVPYASGRGGVKWRHDPAGSVVRFWTALQEAFRPRTWEMYLNPERTRQARRQPRFDRMAEVMPQRRAVRADFRLLDGQVLPGFDDWRVVHTPGHTWDSSCFFHPGSGSLLSGDTLLGSAKQGALVTPSIYSNRRHMLRTLHKLHGLGVAQVYPGHGSPQPFTALQWPGWAVAVP